MNYLKNKEPMKVNKVPVDVSVVGINKIIAFSFVADDGSYVQIYSDEGLKIEIKSPKATTPPTNLNGEAKEGKTNE